MCRKPKPAVPASKTPMPKQRRDKRDRISIIVHNNVNLRKKVYKKVDNSNDSDVFSAIMGIAGLAMIAMVYMAAVHGWRGRVSVVGIDLGTTNSVVCVQALSHTVGEIECIPDPYNGSNLIPSVVSFPEHNKQKVLVGKAAAERINGHAHSTVYHAKRFLGRTYSDAEVQDLIQEYDFSVVEYNEELTLYKDNADAFVSLSNVPIIDEEAPGNGGGGVLFHIPSMSKLSSPFYVSPESIGSYVIKHLIQITNDYLGHENVKGAIIAVPAKFTVVQRQATAMAFKLAGIKVTRVLEEPVAAALAYGLHRKPNVDHILVYDFGGGTLDVSVLHVTDGYVDVMASEGDDTLGGADFDAAIAHYLMSKPIYARVLQLVTNAVHELHNLGTMVDSETEQVADMRIEEKLSENCSRLEIIPLCHSTSFHTIGEKLKISLSSMDEATEICLGINENFMKETEQKLLSLEEFCSALTPVEVSITKSEFIEASSALLQRSRLPIRSVIASLDLSPDEIDEVVMVGGTSRMPAIRDLVKDELNISSLNTHIDPDITVAYGCASVID